VNKILIIFFSLLIAFSCATNPLVQTPPPAEKLTQFSEHPYAPSVEQRDYKRMNRERLEAESQLNASAGSTWVMEGQGAYLFTQNKSRKEGDLLNVKIEGPALKQVEMKVSVIKKLLDQIEEQNKKYIEGDLLNKQDKGLLGEKNSLSGSGRAPAGAADTALSSKKASESKNEEAIEISSIPTRVTQKMPDGSYRVQGQQPFMLGQKEFKVLITGFVRPEDFNDEGTSSNRLLDSQVDVLSIRKKTSEETR